EIYTFEDTVSLHDALPILCGSGFDTVLSLYDGCLNAPLACDDDSCGVQSQVVLTLNAGQAYWARVSSHAGLAGGTYRLTVTGPGASPPSNNACGAPIALTPNVPVFGTTAGATGNDASPSCGALDRADIWYNHAPQASGLHIVELCSTAFDTTLSVRTSCVFSQEIGCSDDAAVSWCGGVGSRVAFNANVGQPFFVRVAGTNDSFGPFELRMYTAQANDLCANAVLLQPGVAAAGRVTPAVGTEQTEACAPSAGDVWYSYLARVSGPHTFETCGADFDTVLSVFSACPGVPGSAELACDDDGCGVAGGASRVTVDLTVGQTYFLRVAGKLSGQEWAFGSFMIVGDVATPANDTCSGALPLGLGLPVVSATFGADGTDVSSCGGNDGADVWYRFIPPETGAYEFSTCASVLDTVLSVFAGCGGAEVGCSDDEPAVCGSGAKSAALTVGLTAGQTYVLRVAGASGQTGRFRLLAVRVPATNSACGGATPPALPVGTAIGGTLSGASASGFAGCEGVPTADVYYTFTPVQTRAYQIDTCGSVFEVALSVHDGCPPGGEELACSRFDLGECGGGVVGSAVTPVLRAGRTYTVRVARREDAGAGPFQVLVTPVSPVNDSCDRAEALDLGTQRLGTTVGATGTDLTPCAMGDTRDVWFRFVPDLSGSYEFQTCVVPGGAAMDTTLAVFEDCPGEPGATGVPIACNDDDPGACADEPPGGTARFSRVIVRLEAGRDVLLRVSGVGGAQGSFRLLATYARPANDLCAEARVVSAGAHLFDTLGATSDPISADQSCGLPVNPVLNDVWFRYAAPASGAVVVNACESTFDTVLTVSLAPAGCAPGAGPVAACNDDFDCDGNPATVERGSRVAFAAAAGQAYLIRVGSRAGDRGAGVLRISQQGVGSCPCDWDRSGSLTLQDVFEFVNGWFNGQGDFNGSGQTTLGDLFEFLGCYLSPPAGC
ncbi:MAG: hypothetical protein ACK4WH_10795, partial [Phycisphaerales bacterium]